MVKLTKERRRRFRDWQVAAGRRVPRWLSRSFGSTVHHLDLWLIDYGVLREIYPNQHRVTGEIWRSAQPAPRHLRQLAARGVRTVVNLRGEEAHGAYWLEQEACARLGLKLVDVKLKSRAAPKVAELTRIRDAIAQIDGPTLIHCKSGSDRTGLFCGLYLILREGVPVEEARRQLALRYGHVRASKTGVLDRFFDQYLEDTSQAPIPFVQWLDTVYDPQVLTAKFRADRWYHRAGRAVGIVK